MIDVIPLIVMSDVGRSARSENGENARIIEASGVRGTVLDLEAGTETISAHVYRAMISAPMRGGPPNPPRNLWAKAYAVMRFASQA